MAASHNDPLNNYARNIVKNHHDVLRQKYGITMPAPHTPSVANHPVLAIPQVAPKVGIIGGGIGGLYAAYLLQQHGIPYEILEASPRLGGRLFTHRMGDRPNDYYDVGAMRFPRTPIMQPLFTLFETIGLKLGDYYFQDNLGNSALLYNDTNKQRRQGPITPQDFDITGVPAEPWGNLGYEKNVSNVVDPFAQLLLADFVDATTTGWDLMMQYDQYSMKAYMAGNRADTQPFLDEAGLMPYPINVVNWCETFDTSSGSYDKALTEAVMDTLAFSWDGTPFSWKHIIGGSSELALTLDQYMSAKPGYTRPFFNTRVVGVSCVSPNDATTPRNVSQVVEAAEAIASKRSRADGGEPPQVDYVTVHLADGSTKQYSHVITTTTLPCLRVMNLTRARLDWQQKEALRMLEYGPSTKIGVRFRRRWWEDDDWMKQAGAYGAILGGQSYSDTMSRTVVYPSYGVGEPESGASIIVSYTWTNDALALTALTGTESRGVLKQRVLQDLVEIHRLNPGAAAELENMWEDVYPFSWSTDPNTMGAFAFFGPGDFKKLYPAMTRPAAGGRLHFAGEVCSVRHAWVLGALEASHRAVYEILQSSYTDEEATGFEAAFGIPEGWTKDLLRVQRALGIYGAVGEFPPTGTV